MQTPIFTDDTGRRTVRARWIVRAISAALVLGAAAVVLSLVTHVSLPSLGLPNPVSGGADTSVQKPRHSERTAEPSVQPTKAGSSTAASTTTGSSAATATPTTGSTKSTDAPRATPTHTPGAPPSTPPGKAK